MQYHVQCMTVALLHTAGLTVDNVRKALHGIHWREVRVMLCIPDSKLSEIEGEYHSDEEREVAVIRYWILRDPYASWRRIIDQLERDRKHDHAITLYHYSEELTGTYVGSTNHTFCAPQAGIGHRAGWWESFPLHGYPFKICMLHSL